MTDAFIIETDLQQFQAAMRRAPGVIERHISKAIRNGLNRIAVTAKLKAPKAFSTLASSIGTQMLSALEGIVGPSTNYGEFVEKGTGPGGRAPLTALQTWIKAKQISPRHPEIKGDPERQIRQLAFLIQRSILAKGTPAQPYLVPAGQEHAPQIHANIDLAIEQALQEIATR